MDHIDATRSAPARFILAALVAACSSPTSSGPATSLAVLNLPSSVTVGAPATLTVTAKDASGNTITGYRGTVHITTTDAAAQLPPNYTFANADAGSHGFTVTFQTPGNQVVVATDVAADSITGSQATTVIPALYVTNVGTYTVTAYSASATGNVLPTASIMGGNTSLLRPFGIARDAAGRIYVANDGTNAITVYAAGAIGNAAPVAEIGGSNTGINQPYGIALAGCGKSLFREVRDVHRLVIPYGECADAR